MDEAAEEVEQAWAEHRRRVLDVGYRMLGSVADAEEVTQEAFLRLARADRTGIEDVRGWLITVVGRLCLDRLRADARRAAYIGPWLPEPVVDPGPGIEDRVTLDDSVRMALLVVLEQLSPAERTAFVLHDVFQVPFDDIADTVGRSAAACRQLAARARRRIAESPATSRFEVSPPAARALAARFAAACERGDLAGLVAVLDPDVTGEFDSGGLVPGAPLEAVSGADAVATILVVAFDGSGASFELADINAEPGVLVRVGGHVAAAITFAVADGRITALHAIGNPDKLQRLQPPV